MGLCPGCSAALPLSALASCSSPLLRPPCPALHQPSAGLVNLVLAALWHFCEQGRCWGWHSAGMRCWACAWHGRSILSRLPRCAAHGNTAGDTHPACTHLPLAGLGVALGFGVAKMGTSLCGMTLAARPPPPPARGCFGCERRPITCCCSAHSLAWGVARGSQGSAARAFLACEHELEQQRRQQQHGVLCWLSGHCAASQPTLPARLQVAQEPGAPHADVGRIQDAAAVLCEA